VQWAVSGLSCSALLILCIRLRHAVSGFFLVQSFRIFFTVRSVVQAGTGSALLPSKCCNSSSICLYLIFYFSGWARAVHFYTEAQPVVQAGEPLNFTLGTFEENLVLFLINSRQWQMLAKRMQLPFLITVAFSIPLHSTYAAAIYKCKQADGMVSFQETPCTPSDTQSIVKTIRTDTPKAASVSPAEPSVQAGSEYTICRQTGINIFDPSRSQELQHPQSAFILCKRTLPSPMNENSVCVNSCVQAWVGEYEKKYLSKGR
jgi:hypothetical protein